MEFYLHTGIYIRRYSRLVRARWGNKTMELYLQFGYGMMDHCRSLVTQWSGGTVILSPRDLSDDQLERLADSINRLQGGSVVVDPQFYVPHSDHERLCSHDYWPQDYQTGLFWQGQPLRRLLTSLQALNTRLNTREFILPGMLANSVDDDWLGIQSLTLEEARAVERTRPVYPTIALGPDAVRDQDQIANLLEAAAKWNAEGYYIVCQHPNGRYLVDDPIWLANLLDLVAGLRLAGARTIIGYCNHQMLVLATVKATAIASGTWMNVRSFPPEKFGTVYEEEVRQRATWYYCPQALSEYKIPFIDIANRMNLLGLLEPPVELRNEHSSRLFTGVQPSTVGFTEQAAFRHYLTCLRFQTANAVRSTFDETVAAHEGSLDEAEALLSTLGAARVTGQLRDFREIVDVNRASLAVLIQTRGAILRRKWGTL